MSMDEQDDFESGGLPPFLFDPLGVLRRRWRWMLLTLLVALAGAALFMFNVKPVYRAAATVLVARQDISEAFVRSTVREDPFQKINAMLGEILARPKLGMLVEKYDLYPELRETRPMAEIVARMRGSIEINPAEGIAGLSSNSRSTAQLLTIEFESEDPKDAADVANNLAQLFSEAGIRLGSERAELTTQFLRKSLERADGELREQGQKIAEYKTQHRGELPADLEPNLRELQRLQEQRQSAALRIIETENREVKLSSGASSPRQRLMALNADLARALAVHTELHPNIAPLRREIEELERAIAAGGAADSSPEQRQAVLLGADRKTLEELRSQLVAAEMRSRELERRVANIPKREEELGALEEKEGVLQETYTDLLGKVQEAVLSLDLERAQQGGHVSILESAPVPNTPTQSRMLFAAACIAAAIALAVAVGVLLELVDPVLVASSDTRSVESIPVLGSVPWIA